MKRFLLLLGLGGLAACSPAAPPNGSPPVIDETKPLPSPLPDVAARVNGQPIYLRQIVGLAREGLERSEDREKAKPGALRRALNQYVVRELLFREALSRNLAADPARLDQLYDDMRLQYRDEKGWAEYLKTMGQTPQSFKEELRVQQTVQALVGQESEKVQLGEEEARSYLAANPNAFGLGDRVTVSHILFRAAPKAPPQKRAQIEAKARMVLERLRKGEDFVKVAKALSEDEATRAQGGRLPELERGRGDPRFEDAAFGLRVGDLSDVVQTPSGFEILKSLEKRIQGVAFEDVQDRLEPQLLRKKRQESLQGLVDRLRARARIESFL